MLTKLYLPNWWERKSTAVFAGDTCLSLFVSLAQWSLFPPRYADVVDELVVFRGRWSMADRILKISNPAKTFLLNMIKVLA